MMMMMMMMSTDEVRIQWLNHITSLGPTSNSDQYRNLDFD